MRDGSLFSLGADDLPGPFWDEPLPLPSQAGGPSGQVFDVCDIRGAYVIWYGFEPSVNALAEFQSDWGRLSADCRMEREPDGLFARYALVVDYVSSPLFETKDEAFAWGRQYARELRVEQWDSLPFGIEARGITGYSTHHPFIQFAPADTPVGRVEVVAGSVDQRDGVIRGLIRNRSRRQFAYDVRVTYRGESWSWPLAMQPGELAAFELKHAETDTTLQVDQIVVKARLSAEADLSRNVNFNCGHGPFEANAQTVPIMLPEEIRSALPSNGRHTIQSDCGRMGLRTTSHPGLPHYADGVSVDVLAAFVAFLDQERVVEVLRVPVAATYMHNNEQGDEIWASRVITSLPLQHPHLRGFEYPELTVTVAAPPSEGPDPYQYLVWIGRAHE
ncbi:hypothetical protein [Candidatus Poriferisodalis sp.]|uniref:hypothetical protein n=1 Tax=Candidatus Poriferisodalis sp. TaxID=3101277 RepID=UPI003B024EBD